MARDSSLQELRKQVEREKLQRELIELRASSPAGLLESSEEWGSWVGRVERDAPDDWNAPEPRISRADDRRDGDNRPHWQDEQTLSIIRGVSKFIAETDEVGISALDNLANYALGEGLAYVVKAKDAADESFAKDCQKALDIFLERNFVVGPGDRESFVRGHRDGEALEILRHKGGRLVDIERAEPAFLTEPGRARELEEFLGLGSLNWKYGIGSALGRPSKRFAYFIQWDGNPNDWDVFPEEEIVHWKLNVDDVVKRGLSDYWAVYRNLERAAGLLGNTLQGSAVQATISYIREHAEGVGPDSIKAFRDAQAQSVSQRRTQKGSETYYSRKEKVKAVDLPQGAKYHAGPLGTPHGPSYIQIVQAALRIAGIRWTMPEYMISGDASNANFSSTLVAESPFVRATIARQGAFKTNRIELARKMLKLLARKGKLGNYEPIDIDEKLTISVEFPEVAVRNKLEDHNWRKSQYEHGFLSIETWAAEEGRKLEEEREKGAKPMAMGPASGPALVPGRVMESLVEALRSPWRGYP